MRKCYFKNNNGIIKEENLNDYLKSVSEDKFVVYSWQSLFALEMGEHVKKISCDKISNIIKNATEKIYKREAACVEIRTSDNQVVLEIG